MSDDAIAVFKDAYNVSRETMERLQAFEALFQQWSKRINLVAASTKHDFWQRHVADSAQLLTLKPEMRKLVDLGSGGGFPGMVLAILLQNVQGSRVDLVESNRKKTAFLQAARAKCAPSALVHGQRIEDVLPDLPTPEFVSARALASLDKLLPLAAPMLSRGAVGLFHKGRGFRQEVEESRANWHFDLIVHQSVVDPESVILEISRLNRA